MRTDKYKYIEYQNHVRPRELYDLQKDPDEKINLMESKNGAAVAAGLKMELERLKRETVY